jgi:hypothetical protein
LEALVNQKYVPPADGEIFEEEDDPEEKSSV